jgi:hypothetical protein
MGMHLYQVVGRHLPVVKKAKGSGEVLSVENKQKIYRMKVFAEDEVRASPRRAPGAPRGSTRRPPGRRRPRCSAGLVRIGAMCARACGVCARVCLGARPVATGFAALLNCKTRGA